MMMPSAAHSTIAMRRTSNSFGMPLGIPASERESEAHTPVFDSSSGTAKKSHPAYPPIMKTSPCAKLMNRSTPKTIV